MHLCPAGTNKNWSEKKHKKRKENFGARFTRSDKEILKFIQTRIFSFQKV